MGGWRWQLELGNTEPIGTTDIERYAIKANIEDIDCFWTIGLFEKFDT